ncbi:MULTISPECIES: glycosyltransferase [Klebsiella pneumoniae complex]|nr:MULTISPECIES: glycosyltransferase [Klebsiella]MBC4813799.1 glycosyltransferase [Klebsiella quasipneumoniae]MDL4021958.1 glycosyltransferase [Klebsiella quasipneumoniae]MDZ3230172.1 glycosyltransferase [Klebsiella quasipneumoniae]MDZ3235488.1 glycosyltransferase [Klebsiella quasipneumoniae]HDE1462971.1 glycosyltransferase [Klebsiella quasipneumoniae]
MKILHVAEVVKGGVASVMNQLIAGQENGNDLKIIIPRNQLSEIQINNKNNIIPFNSIKRSIYSHFNLLKTFIISVIKFKPDVIHIHSTFAGVICRLSLFILPSRNIKIVYCPHAFSFMMDNHKYKKNIYILIERFLSLVTQKIICVSDHEYNEAVTHGFKKDKLVTIYNGVPDFGEPARKKWLLNDKLNILFVGRFERQKGYDLLLEVIKHFSNREDIYFHLVGDFVDNKDKTYINTNNTVTYGWMPHEKVLDLYQNADLLIMPSRWEGLPMAALEALNAGLPILASNCSAFPELIEQNENGFLFENENVGDIINVILNILNDSDVLNKLKAMSNKCREIYLNKYDARIMIDETYKLYN